MEIKSKEPSETIETQLETLYNAYLTVQDSQDTSANERVVYTVGQDTIKVRPSQNARMAES
jgi:hypothetical protein